MLFIICYLLETNYKFDDNNQQIEVATKRIKFWRFLSDATSSIYAKVPSYIARVTVIQYKLHT